MKRIAVVKIQSKHQGSVDPAVIVGGKMDHIRNLASDGDGLTAAELYWLLFLRS
jgi:hypothetical protein